jgi:hypothetical protein
MTESAEARHYLWTAIQATTQVNAVRELHRQTMDSGGVATGKCRECGKSSPCPTALAVAREPDGPCTCGPDCPKNAGTLTAPSFPSDPGSPS